MKNAMKYKVTNQDELDQFIKDNNVIVEKSNLPKQLQGFETIPDLERALKNGMMIFLVCMPFTIKSFIVKMAEDV